jgi:hypothetical protein
MESSVYIEVAAYIQVDVDNEANSSVINLSDMVNGLFES